MKKWQGVNTNSSEFDQVIHQDDIIILQLSQTIKKEFIEHEHTRRVVLSKPYRHDVMNMDQIIYDRNLKYLKNLHGHRKSRSRFLECNNSLWRSKYKADGYSLMKVANAYLGSA